jgi:hypothetical protein
MGFWKNVPCMVGNTGASFGSVFQKKALFNAGTEEPSLTSSKRLKGDSAALKRNKKGAALAAPSSVAVSV